MFSKFCQKDLKAFRVILEACFYLTNTTLSLSGKIDAGFWVNLLLGPRLLLVVVPTMILFMTFSFSCSNIQGKWTDFLN